MRRFLAGSGLPILAKDLAVEAERKKTYVLRVLLVLLLAAAFFISLASLRERSGGGGLRALGGGREIFRNMIHLQLAAIFVYVPALVAGAIAREKERGALSLLLLTTLGRGEIVIEKLLGRLVPILSRGGLSAYALPGP